jgi:hypothetical protein
MTKILIYDDDEKWARSLKKQLENLPVVSETFEIVVLDEDTFKNSMDVLESRQRMLRSEGEWSGGGTPLDEASIFVIDYDLLAIDSRLTGEEVAYSVRCFSKCGLIIALNQYVGIEFDLTLKGHPESFADLNITGEQLSNPNLWGGAGVEFRPWYWPILSLYAQDFERRVDDVRHNLNKPIWEILGFVNRDVFDMLPRSIGQFIGNEPAETTFEEFVKKSGNGLRHKDAERTYEDVFARVGAARIGSILKVV